MSRYFTRQSNGTVCLIRPPFLAEENEDDFRFEQDGPMSGAGYDIEEYNRRREMDYMRIEHAIQRAIQHYTMRPIEYEYAKFVRYIILEKARDNCVCSGGTYDDEFLTRMVETWNRNDIKQCIQEPPRSVPTQVIMSQPDIEPKEASGSSFIHFPFATSIEEEVTGGAASGASGAASGIQPESNFVPPTFTVPFATSIERQASGGGSSADSPTIQQMIQREEEEFDDQFEDALIPYEMDEDEFDFLNM